VVTDTRDPSELGRVKVRLVPGADEYGSYDAWARPATLAAGPNHGSYFMPDVGGDVLVAFEAGDVRRPFVVGALWSEKSPPPVTAAGNPQNNRKMLRSRSGVTIELDDSQGHERLVLVTPAGQSVTLTDGPSSIEIGDGSGNTIRMQGGTIEVISSGRVQVTASDVSVSAALVNVNAGIAKFSGVVQTDTLIANAVVASSYSPGAGNIW
jgi:uncharacterized protein involved in type VI secretion and phage assembly